MTIPYYDNVSRTAARALEEFSDDFRGAYTLGEVTPWAETLGHVRVTDAIKTTFPIPISAAGYKEFRDDIRYRPLYARSLSMRGKLWQDGVEALARTIEAPDFSDWAGEPQRMAVEALRLPNQLVAEQLAVSNFAGPLLDLYRNDDSNEPSTRRMFAADHPFNVLDPSIGSFDNRLSVTLEEIESGEAFDAINAHFRSIMGPNGKPLGLRLAGGHILTPTDHEMLFRRALENETLIKVITEGSGVAAAPDKNMWSGTIAHTVAEELLSQDYFYAFAAGRPGLFPWVVQKGRIEEIVHDKDSALYKSTLKVAFASLLELNAALAMPQGIVRVEITDA